MPAPDARTGMEWALWEREAAHIASLPEPTDEQREVAPMAARYLDLRRKAAAARKRMFELWREADAPDLDSEERNRRRSRAQGQTTVAEQFEQDAELWREQCGDELASQIAILGVDPDEPFAGRG